MPNVYQKVPYSPWDRIQKSFLKFDLYRKPVQLLLPDRADAYRSLCGSVLSLVTFILMLAYGIYKVTTLVDFNDAKVERQHHEDFFDLKELKPGGFQIAAAVIQWDTETGSIEDPEIGEINFYLKRWED